MRGFGWMNARTASEAAAATTMTVADAMVVQANEGPAAGIAVVKAGGLDLLDLMKQDLIAPHRIVNLRGVAGLDEILDEPDGSLRIGALVTLARLGEHPAIRARYAALADAAAHSASPQIRHVATLGGNVLQRPRCWYFRSSDHHCVRKGGNACFAFAGENQYHAIFGHDGCAMVHPSTAATALVARGATVELATSDETKREVPLENFLLSPRTDLHRENDLKPGEILAAVVLPPAPVTLRSVHLKQGERAFDWPIADVAVALDVVDGGTCRKASIVLGAAAPVPHRAKAAEDAMSGKRVDEQTARAAAHAALLGAAPLAKNAYKLPIFETLVRRAILAAVGRA